MPGTSGGPSRAPIAPLSPHEERIATALHRHVASLATEIGERNLWRWEALEEAAGYVARTLESLDYPVTDQRFEVRGLVVRNVETVLRGHETPARVVVVGAHYDTVEGCPGADDNASGVAVLLELARLLRDHRPGTTLRLVAFVNEEPPFFPGPEMGSVRHAERAYRSGEEVVAMLSLESLGYFDTRPRSQRYPPPLGLFYPGTGDFVAFVGNLRSRSLVRRAARAFRRRTELPCQLGAFPPFLPGISWSDHASYWRFGYPAVMVTDTAPYRNPYYHTPGDTPETLDLGRTARVVTGLEAVVETLAGRSSGGQRTTW
jgi:Zn-dependent M28 family amino/carboxypeptidase